MIKKQKQKKSKSPTGKKTKDIVPYHKKPEDMDIREWQTKLRQQFAIDQDFDIINTGGHPVYSDFSVINTVKHTSYKVSIRKVDSGLNFCSCPDFKVNHLGTCKHIEYVLHKLRINPETGRLFNDMVTPAYSSITLKYGQTRAISLRIGTVHADAMKKLSLNYFEESGILKADAIFTVDQFIKKAEKLDPDFRVYPDAMDNIFAIREGLIRKEKAAAIFPEGPESPLLSSIIKTGMYKYQRDGVIFGINAGRFILADDMGLGKTIQAIALAELLIKKFQIRKTLIVCPTSLKYQWASEITKFTGRKAAVIEGMQNSRKKQYKNSVDFSIISYGIVVHDIDEINRLKFDLVILDEAQRIKNWNTKTAKSVKQISTPYAAVLTGTPLENRLDELHSLVEFVDRYRLGPLYRFLFNHQICDESGKVIGYRDLHKISESLKDILIRRTKAEIKNQLPDRIDKNYFVEMTAVQRDMHDEYLSVVSRIVTKWKKTGRLKREERQILLISLNCMRMACDSTYILDQNSRNDTKIGETMNILSDIFESGAEKVIIFSQWERMTSLVSEELDRLGTGYEYLHGRVPAKKRKQLVSNFHNDKKSRVFLSTDAGGVGLNLQCASVIINLDIPWNPAVLEQRIGRAHRLGQKNTVRVINLVSHGSIEHRILHLLEFKRSLFKGILEDGSDIVLMSEKEAGSFMESIEALTDINEGGIYFTPNSTVDDEDTDYQKAEDNKPVFKGGRFIMPEKQEHPLLSGLVKPVIMLSNFLRRILKGASKK